MALSNSRFGDIIGKILKPPITASKASFADGFQPHRGIFIKNCENPVPFFKTLQNIPPENEWAMPWLQHFRPIFARLGGQPHL